MGISSTATIDCAALTSNYAQLKRITAPHCGVGAVVKADGYGAGMEAMAQTLASSGCSQFYTAQLTEAITLRAALSDADILCFEGPQTLADMQTHREYNIIPIINSAKQFDIYKQDAKDQQPLAFWLHFDTGMARLGLSAEEIDPKSLSSLPIAGYMSHLASADTPENNQNDKQLDSFKKIISKFPAKAMSLANSGGAFLGDAYHFDCIRPGLALHGYASDARQQGASGLQPILRWDATILQLRTLKKGDTVGYAASFVADRDMRVATIGAGYADGYNRMLQNQGKIDVGGFLTQPIGRISMDLMVIDVTHIPEQTLNSTQHVCLLGPHYTAQDMAYDLDTIPYEILTALGDRVVRAYDTSS